MKFPFFISQFFLVSFSQTFLVLSMYYTLPTSLSLKYFSFFPVSHTTRLSLSQIFFVLFLYYALPTSLSRRSFSFFSCITYYQPVFLSNLSRPFLVLHTTHLSFSRMFLVLSVYYTLPNSLSLKSFSFFLFITHYPPVFLSKRSRSFRPSDITHLSFLSNLSRSFCVSHTTRLSFSQNVIFPCTTYYPPCIAHCPPLFLSNGSRSFPV